MVLTLAYVGATFYFGLRAHSLALISEAGHNVSDLLAIALSFVAVYFQARPATDQKTFGYQRAGVLAAFVNAVTLVVLSAWIAIEAIHRLSAPVAVQPRMMMYVAAAGVLMNGTVATLLWRFSGDVNIRSVFLHMLGDTLSTAAVIAGGAAILFSGMTWIDPVLSILIAGMILWSSVGIIRETLNILLEGTPRNLQLGRDSRGDGLSRRRSGCSRPACVESGVAVACSGEPCDDCRDADVGVRRHSDRASTVRCAIAFTSRIRRFSLKRRAARPPMGAARRRSWRLSGRTVTIMGMTITAMPTRSMCG